ncbi:thymidylate synthase [Vavraia culicis subsp. floridensis]|uniref:thymidylate synthase n=1 Tax=Vavraia culicis (isolate floridensis) TaxID=948595 RepID=L2GXG6_VAVCU|nr:thymidylate synthase [Vavraia culicis subsp. floridensis]ELA48329.1 thymidylate synthase [Vavraia culicis subsp. floridensis]
MEKHENENNTNICSRCRNEMGDDGLDIARHDNKKNGTERVNKSGSDAIDCNDSRKSKAKQGNVEEKAYLNLIEHVIAHGIRKEDRTGTGTISLTGQVLRFSLENNAFPLLTTKKTAYDLILKELLFFVKAQTDNKILTSQNVNIWNANSTDEFFKQYGINRPAGDLGPIYGFQWRHFGAPYKTSSDNYDGQGIDQLQNIIDEIKRDKNSRRLIVSAWNPLCIKEMALPPCHTMYHIVILNDKITLILYQRSGDMGLGVPFNIASYSILAAMIGYMTGYELGEFVHVIGDAHVYSNHVDALKTQLKREPYEFPKLYIRPKRKIERIEDFEYEDFELEGYRHYEKITMKMAV